MPELPEVEHFRRLAMGFVGQNIDEVEIATDALVFDQNPAEEIREALQNKRLRDVQRWGKALWFELDVRPWPLFHFGMSGAFRIPEEEALPLAHGPAPSTGAWPPKHRVLGLRFSKGGELAFSTVRRIARVRLRQDPKSEPPVANLGFDPYLALPSSQDFRALLGQRKRGLKALLLDQSFSAGIGNWLVDEILLEAKLAPTRRANTLSPQECAALHRSVRNIVRNAVVANAKGEKFPQQWLFHRRWGRKAARTKDASLLGHPIERTVVAGRSTFWIPELQR